MKEYQVFLTISGEVTVKASSYEDAVRVAEDDGYRLLQYTGEVEVEDIYEIG